MNINTYSGSIKYENYIVDLGEKLRDVNGKAYTDVNGKYYTAFHIDSFVRMEFPYNQNNSNYFSVNIILNTNIKEITSTIVKFHSKKQAMFTNQFLLKIQQSKKQDIHTNSIDTQFLNHIEISDFAASYYTAFETLYFMKSDILSGDIIGDSNTSVLSSIGGALVAGGLGMIASKINPNTKYIVNVNTNLYGAIDIKCKNFSVAKSVFTSLGCEKFIENQSKSDIRGNISNNSLKDKLIEIEQLKKDGIITNDEYEFKRKQIIEKY